jgi:Golgi phosphoprotein 3 (GPP34)
VITRDAPHDAVRQHALFKRIADTPEPRPVQSWLRVLAHGAARDVAVRLEEAGYLEHVRGRVPWGQGRWVPVNPDWAFAPVLRARAALDPARRLTAHSTTLAGLMFACGLGFRLGDDQTSAGRPVQEAVAQLGPGLQVLIAQTETAIESAVLSYRNTW